MIEIKDALAAGEQITQIGDDAMKPSEIRHYAHALMKWHASSASAQAARRAAKLIAEGDPASAKDWGKIEKRILEWQALERASRNPQPAPARESATPKRSASKTTGLNL